MLIVEAWTIDTSCSGASMSAMLFAERQVPARPDCREGRSPMKRVGPGSAGAHGPVPS
jgi:hypothetical protein